MDEVDCPFLLGGDGEICLCDQRAVRLRFESETESLADFRHKQEGGLRLIGSFALLLSYDPRAVPKPYQELLSLSGVLNSHPNGLEQVVTPLFKERDITYA
jgi:hypothetical protein